MKRRIKTALVIAAVVIIGALAVVVAGDAGHGESDLNATDNLTKAQEIADEQDKEVFVVFTSHACSWCEKLEQDTLSDERIISKLNEEYVTAIVDIDKQPEVARAYNAVATPIMVFLDSNGTEEARLNGYYGPEELLEYM